VLVDDPVDVAPLSGDLHVGLVHEPAIAAGVAARPSRVDEQRREALHPPVHGHVVDLDPALAKQLLDIARREAVPQVRTQREDNHLRREPEALERRSRYGERLARTMAIIPLLSPVPTQCNSASGSR
jgi:hypothetical protein